MIQKDKKASVIEYGSYTSDGNEFANMSYKLDSVLMLKSSK